MAILEVRDLEVNYGLIRAIKGVSFEVGEGEIIALIGANGAGKTTILQSVIGLIPIKGGSVTLYGQNVTHTPTQKIVKMGMAEVPEGRRVFAELTVYENLQLGAYTRRDKKEFSETLDAVYAKFPILKERARQEAGTLSGGEQQMLAMGRALMDEPSMGLSPLYVSEIFKTIQEINKSGTTILLVEQNARKALSIADRAYVLETGTIAFSGKASELAGNDQIKKAYLGE